MSESQQVAELAGLIQQFRASLLDAGFVHANAVGELASELGTVWLSTGYGMGEFQVNTWLRPTGAGVHERNVRLRVHRMPDRALLDQLVPLLTKMAGIDPNAQPQAFSRTWTRVEKLGKQAHDGTIE